MGKTALIILSILLALLLIGRTGGAQGPGPITVGTQVAKGEPGQGREGSAKMAKAAVKDPFLPPLEQASLKLRYQYTGRYVGEEILVVKGQRRLSEFKAVDTAFGLDRPVHRLTLETPERIVHLDLIAGSGQARPNLRGILSRLWQELDDEAKFHLNQNLPVFALALGAGFRSSVKIKEVQLGLPAVLINLGSDQAWYWAETDLVLGQVGVRSGWRWKKTAIDVQANVDAPESLFSLPESDRLEVRAEEQAWTEGFARQVIDLLVRPLVGREAKSRREEDTPAKAASLVVPVAWPVPAPPGYRSEAERYRLLPSWRPYPLPPTERPWPPPGLGGDVVAYEAGPLAERLNLKIKESLGPSKPQPGEAGPRGTSGPERTGAGPAQ